MLIEGKVALITGGAKGIGKAYSEALLKKGASVGIVDLNETAGVTTVAEFQQLFGTDQVVFIKCDVTNKTELEDAFKQTKEVFGGLHIVINNAGTASHMGDDFQTVIDINLSATMRGSFLAVEHMREDKGGQGGVVINISSILGFQTINEAPEYVASKYGVQGFTKTYAATFGEETSSCGVRINMLCPTYVQTDLTAGLTALKDNSTRPGIFKHYGGWLSLEDLASAMIRLVEEEEHHGKAMLVTSKGQEFINPTKHWVA